MEVTESPNQEADVYRRLRNARKTVSIVENKIIEIDFWCEDTEADWAALAGCKGGAEVF